VRDETYLLVLHADTGPDRFTLPGEPWASRWEQLLDSDRGIEDRAAPLLDPGSVLTVQPRSAVLLRAALTGRHA
jgi:glycogen operon protein